MNNINGMVVSVKNVVKHVMNNMNGTVANVSVVVLAEITI
jgi:hypothetical protein